jgi:hypothetical protein
VFDAFSFIGAVLFLSIFLLYFAACWWIAKYAERKGQNLALFFLLGVLVSPIISLIAALLVRDPRDDRLDALQKITNLRDAGTLSPQEFETEKARILAEGV